MRCTRCWWRRSRSGSRGLKKRKSSGNKLSGGLAVAERIWDKFLTESDKAVFAASGYGALQGFGKRPALLIIDVNYFFCGDRPEPIMESIKRWRNSCGEVAWPAI